MVSSSSSSRFQIRIRGAEPKRAPIADSVRLRSAMSAEGAEVSERVNSGKCTSPMPRSVRGSSAHRSATARVRASSRRAASLLPEPGIPGPARRQISSATSCICLPDLRKPSALPRLADGPTSRRCEEPSGTRRRVASRTSMVGASSRSA